MWVRLVEGDAGKGHEGHGNKAGDDESDAHAAKPFRDVGVGEFFSNGSHKDNRKPPSKAGAEDVEEVVEKIVAAGGGKEASA